jgi:hypothetical protein
MSYVWHMAEHVFLLQAERIVRKQWFASYAGTNCHAGLHHFIRDKQTVTQPSNPHGQESCSSRSDKTHFLMAQLRTPAVVGESGKAAIGNDCRQTGTGPPNHLDIQYTLRRRVVAT